MRILRNKFFRTVMLIALLFCAAVTTLTLMGVESPAGHVAGLVTTPVKALFSSIARGLDGFSVYFERVEDLAHENYELQKELTEVKARLADAEKRAMDDEYLRAYLGLEELVAEYDMIDAKIIAKEPETYGMLLTLNKGSISGVKKGMTVITDKGVVGIVTSTGSTYSYVDPIISPKSAVGVYDARSGADGLLRGDMKLRNTDECFMDFTDNDADIQVEDEILTSGVGGAYPGGLCIGYVSEVIPDAVNRTLKVKVRLAENYSDTVNVMIISEKSE